MAFNAADIIEGTLGGIVSAVMLGAWSHLRRPMGMVRAIGSITGDEGRSPTLAP
jgi:hypothetical protein